MPKSTFRKGIRRRSALSNPPNYGANLNELSDCSDRARSSARPVHMTDCFCMSQLHPHQDFAPQEVSLCDISYFWSNFFASKRMQTYSTIYLSRSVHCTSSRVIVGVHSREELYTRTTVHRNQQSDETPTWLDWLSAPSSNFEQA